MTPRESPQGFSGFPLETLAFLAALAANNKRAWFQEHRAAYDRDVLAPLRALVADLVTRFTAARIPLTADPPKAVFRVHRDVRFSRDKIPYKTHAGAVLSRDGAKDGFGVFYVHIDPAGSFAACGFYQPDPARLAAVRTAMATRPKPFLAAMDRLHAAGSDLSRDEQLARLPRGFETAADTPIAPYLKLRHLIARQSLSRRSLKAPALADQLGEFAGLCLPLLRFGWQASGVE